MQNVTSQGLNLVSQVNEKNKVMNDNLRQNDKILYVIVYV